MSRPLRSILFVPGTREDRFTSAISSGADAVVFDLEDSVEESSKTAARQAIGGYLRSASDLAPLPLVRINPVGSRWVNDDLRFASALRGLGGIVLPKTETIEQLRLVAEVVGADRVYPLLETARGVLNALALADVFVNAVHALHSHLAGVVIDCLDLGLYATVIAGGHFDRVT